MDVGRALLHKSPPLGDAAHFLPPSLKAGAKPILARYTDRERAVGYIANEIIVQSKQLGLDFSNFAIISPSVPSKSEMMTSLIQMLPNNEIPCKHYRDEDFMFDDAVSLITMHSAKGLEYPVVFIVDFEEGALPYVGPSSVSPQAIEERARKLAYVSITRAKKRLYFVYPKLNPSRFVYDILNAAKDSVAMVDLD